MLLLNYPGRIAVPFLLSCRKLQFPVYHPRQRVAVNWCAVAMKSRLEPVRDLVKMLRKHLQRVLPFIDKALTKAKAEGLNRIVRIVKNRASGFRSLPAFIEMIFLTVGNLDLPAQIPRKFRTV
jgi:transposase